MEENHNKLDKKEIRKRIFSMILPITIESILQMTAGFVSMALIGRIDAIAIGALGLSMRITQIIWAIFKGVTTGASVFVAQAFGAGNFPKLKKVIQQTLLSTIILVIILQQAIFWNARAILSIFDPKPILMDNALIYLKTVSFGLPFMAIMLVVAGVLQGMGNAKTPMKIAFTMNLLNIIFSFVLIFGYLGISPMGIKGAAIATVLAQVIGAFIGLYVLFNSDGVLHSFIKKGFFQLDFKEITAVYKVGFPTAMESVFWQLAAIILTKVILTFGEIAFAAHQLGLQAESISYMPAAGFGIAATTFIGQALGAKDDKLGKIYLKELVIETLIVTAFCAGILIFMPSLIMRLLTDDNEVIGLGAKYLIIMGLVQIPQNLSGVLNGALRGAGFTKVPMIVAGAGLWGIRIPFSLILTYYFKLNIIAIWTVMAVDLVFRFILSYILYKTKNIYNQKLVFEGDSSK